MFGYLSEGKAWRGRNRSVYTGSFKAINQLPITGIIITM